MSIKNTRLDLNTNIIVLIHYRLWLSVSGSFVCIN